MQEPSLRSSKNRKQLEAAIDTSPAGLDHLYDRDWQRLRRLPKEESTRAVSLLRLAAFALRPLTVAEITEALLIREDDDDFLLDEMPDSIDQDYVDGEILGLCGCLVEVRNAVSDMGQALCISCISPSRSFLSAQCRMEQASSWLMNACAT